MAFDKRKYNREQLAATRARRRSLLSIFPCVCCGDPDDTVIQWHHVDESEKSFTVFCGSGSEDAWWNEVLKCIPVCANCHLKLHKDKLCLLTPRLSQKKSRTEYKPQVDTESTYVRDSTCPQSQLFSQQLNLKSQKPDSKPGNKTTPELSKKLAPGVLPFTSDVKTTFED